MFPPPDDGGHAGGELRVHVLGEIYQPLLSRQWLWKKSWRTYKKEPTKMKVITIHGKKEIQLLNNA